MSTTEHLVIEALNNARLSTKAQQKVQLLTQLNELLIKKEPALLDTVLQELVEFQVDRGPSVRRWLIEFLTAAIAGNVDADGAWSAVQEVQGAVSALACSAGSFVGLRMAGIKMSEQAVLMYTGEVPLFLPGLPAASAAGARLPDASTLAIVADKLLQQLTELLKLPVVQQLPGPVVICAIKACGVVALQRPHLVGKVLPAMLALASKGVFRPPVTGDGQSGVAASVGNVLKDSLARVLRCRNDAITPWQKRLEMALRRIGADAVADSALRHLERQAARARASAKRKATEQAGNDAKLARSGTPGADAAVFDTPGRTPTPTPTPLVAPDAAAMLDAAGQQQQQPPGALDVMSLVGGGSGDTITDLQQILEVLVANHHQAAVNEILDKVQPDVLAELVLRWMVHSMRHAAVRRILGATKNKPIRNFRELLLSRLVSQAPQADGLAELLLHHVLADYHGSRGHLLVVVLGGSLSHLDLSGTAYESALTAILTGLQQRLDASDPAIPRLLQEAPVLPVKAVLGFLRTLLAAGADWVPVGLHSALLLIESRPPLRQQLLHLVLEAAVAADGLIRQKAIGLVVRSGARSAIERYAGSLAKAVGPTNPELLQLLREPPGGSRDLLLVMLQALADQGLPPPPLVTACVTNFAKNRDVLLLAPVTVAMPKADVMKLLPQLVVQLDKSQLRMLYRRLTLKQGGAEPHFKPTELLVALHQLKSTNAVRVTTKQQTAAVDVALHAPEVFPMAVVVQAIQRLEAISPLPNLFMRTVIGALTVTPKLTDMVMELLKRLITKQLPPNILELALEKLNERHWRELLKYATSKEYEFMLDFEDDE
eukprot:gene2918-3205_t